MAEEFQESEVIFSGQDHHDKIDHNNYYISCREMDVIAQLDQPNSRVSCNNGKKAKKAKQKKKGRSVPVNIPSYNNVLGFMDDGGVQGGEYDDGGELVPPHIILGRRIEGKMAFSVCAGNGRTLKGRYLSEFRNSILRMTGFLET